MHLLTGNALYCGECVGRRAPSQVGTCMQNCRSPTLLSAFVIAVVLKPHTLSPCRLPEDGVSRGAHVSVRPGPDVRAGPGGAGGLGRAQGRTGGPALRPGEVRGCLSARSRPYHIALCPQPKTLGPPVFDR